MDYDGICHNLASVEIWHIFGLRDFVDLSGFHVCVRPAELYVTFLIISSGCQWQSKPIKFDSQSKQLKSIEVDRKWSVSNQSKSIEVIVEAIEVNRRFTFYIKFFDWHPWLFDKLFHLWQTLILDFDKTCQSLASVKIWQQSWYFSMVRYT